MSIAFDEDILTAKLGNLRQAIETLERVNRKADEEDLEDWIADDMRVLHLQRAVQALIDLANHLIAEND